MNKPICFNYANYEKAMEDVVRLSKENADLKDRLKRYEEKDKALTNLYLDKEVLVMEIEHLRSTLRNQEARRKELDAFNIELSHKTYKQGKNDAVKEFAEWCKDNGFSFLYQGKYNFFPFPLGDVIGRWQEELKGGADNE